MKNYSLTIPITYDHFLKYDPEQIFAELKRIRADRVFLAIGFYETDAEARDRKLTRLRTVIELVRSHGFEVGVWTWAFAIKQKHSFTFMTDPEGNPSRPFCCPANPDFAAFALDYLQRIAALGPDILLLDDDFRYPNNTLGCCCPHHMKLLSEKLGRTVAPKEVPGFFVGENYAERAAFREVMGGVLYDFARKLRERIDAVNPAVRCGYCSSGTSWFLDGTCATETARLLAGNTRPLMRLHAAPYWTSEYGKAYRSAVVNENSRMQAAYAENSGVEILAEGDVWPRPRYQTPAALLEAFDTAMCTDPHLDGILKYSFDYSSDVTVETGYNDRHVRNLPITAFIREKMAVLPSLGVRVYEYRDKLAEAPLGKEFANFGHLLETDRSARAGLILQDNNIPTSYEGENLPGAVFGQNARLVPLCAADNGLILDIPAAQILQSRGVDVGLLSAEPDSSPTQEKFPSGALAKLWETGGLYRTELKNSARVLSVFNCDSDYQRVADTSAGADFPAAYTYENADGQRFCVLCLDAYACGSTAYRFYDKARQFAEAVNYIGRKPLPAVCSGHPDLYTICRGDEHTLAIGLWNNFADDIPAPVIRLGECWCSLECIAGSGELCGNELRSAPMAPYSFCFFLLHR